MQLFKTIANAVPSFATIISNMEQGKSPSLLVGTAQIHKAHLIFSAIDKTDITLVITDDEASARGLIDDINAFYGSDVAFLYPARDFSFRTTQVPSREFEQARLAILSRIRKGDRSCKVVVASIEAALQHTMPIDYLTERCFDIEVGKTFKTQELATKLIQAGYEPREQVDGTAQFCIRGGIVDIFSPNEISPIRLELWGDSVDTIAYFDIETQRRTEEIKSIEITPASEVLFDSNEVFIKRLTEFIKSVKDSRAIDSLNADLERAISNITINSYDKYIALAYTRPGSLLDYFEDAWVFISEYGNIKERAKNYIWQQQEDLKQLLMDGEMTDRLLAFDSSLEEILLSLQGKKACFLENFMRASYDVKFVGVEQLSSLQTGNFSGEIKLLVEDQKPLLEDGYAVIVLAGTKKAAGLLAEDITKSDMKATALDDCEEIPYDRVSVLSCGISSGLEYPQIKVSVTTTAHAAEERKRTVRHKKGKKLKDLTDLTVGDLVVHISHGIGIFEGIHKLSMQGITKDYIKISYSGADVLYVPVTQLDLVSKYIGAKDDGKVKLNKLHSVEWQKTRARAKQAVDDMADELIALYSKRMQSRGYAFSQDTEWQKDFEQHFPYVETDDQLRCIEEIKADMEREQPMDRVLCGDVGFGKTEVAMRACFKAVMDSKQVAILCPTTILAWQHYQSFLQRFEQFPMNIEVLSRFRTPKEQKAIIKKLKAGEIDIIIGTHRLVQKDIEFKDLGLAIVDEEQRFGVKHKERFKEQFAAVDMLTLSATPIPRTLNMAISGIRDMSTIEQAPQDRHPVQSYVMEYDSGIIMDGIRKELRRGGQVFYIHNNIESIEGCASRIQNAIPTARIATAHGRMEEHELSVIWQKLVEREIDILVCTTIIETGVDVANCNTLVIENADRMGLSQLYQLRGRVGRSNRRASAYFTFTKNKVVSEIAQKRLSAIREFTRFGSGFHIALRDLEIRGAGSLLGASQHGHMEAVGYEMYMRLLSDAIAEKKGEKPTTQSYECLIDLRMDAHIPEEYIETTANRVDVYKKIADVKNEEDKLDIIDELIDRFGEPPYAVLSLIEVALLRNQLAGFGFDEINEKAQAIWLFPHTLNMEQVSGLIEGMKGRILLNASARPYIAVKPKKGERVDAIALLRECVEALKNYKVE